MGGRLDNSVNWKSQNAPNDDSNDPEPPNTQSVAALHQYVRYMSLGLLYVLENFAFECIDGSMFSFYPNFQFKATFVWKHTYT